MQIPKRKDLLNLNYEPFHSVMPYVSTRNRYNPEFVHVINNNPPLVEGDPYAKRLFES